MPTIGETVSDLTLRFAAAGIDNPRLDARVLTAHVLDLPPEGLFSRAGDPFPTAQAAALDAVVARRLRREPVSRIRGFREFYGLDFQIGPATLDPRPDTETIVEAALRLRVPGKAAQILDLGTGSGCILLAILSAWPEARGVGIDLAADAVEVARGNANRLGLAQRATFVQGDWCEGLIGRFDVIVSNPPYIPDGDIPSLEPEVCDFEPPAALRGGKDGLDAYRALAPQFPARLEAGGTVLLEVGQGQAQDVAEILAAHELPHAAFYEDLGGVTRVVAASVRV